MAIPQSRLDQIRDLVNQWEQLVGFAYNVPDWAVNDMASNPNVMNLFQIGQYMRRAQAPAGQRWSIPFDPTRYPWAIFGMNLTEYQSRLQGYSTEFIRLTGQNITPQLFEEFMHASGGNAGPGDFAELIRNRADMIQQFGWLRYGLDHDQFNQQKLQMRAAFGSDLSDQEAVAQLQYFHAAQGQHLGAGIVPTFSQQEKKSAEKGVLEGTVR